MKRCPACNEWTLEFDDYFGRFRCFNYDCGWMPRSSVERAMCLRQSYKEPAEIWSTEIKELGLTFAAKYDDANDALMFNFGLETPSFEFPEGDGRMVWKIARATGSVAGFVILGARKFGVSEVKINFDARKADIEEGLKRVPDAFRAGRVTRVLIENVEVTAAHSREPASAEPTRLLTDAFKAAVAEFEQSFNH